MATKHVCDRCGAERAHWQLKYVVDVPPLDTFDFHHERVDLCLNCMRELKKFLKYFEVEGK